MKNSVIAGEYKGYLIQDFNGLYICPPGLKGLKKENKIYLNPETVESISEKDKNDDSGLSKKIFQQALFGIGATNSKKTSYIIEILFKDGKKSLLDLDHKNYKKLQVACFK